MTFVTAYLFFVTSTHNLSKGVLEKKIEELSQGQKRLIELIRLKFENHALYILDKPTTHLDIESLEMFDQLLKEFPGGMMFVSHDRAFIAQNAQKLLKLENGYLELMLIKR